MITGSLTLNGLDDEDMQLIFEMRAKTPLLFNPSGTTIRTKGHIQAYNNVVMGWTEGSGLAAVMEILNRLNEVTVSPASAMVRVGEAKELRALSRDRMRHHHHRPVSDQPTEGD